MQFYLDKMLQDANIFIHSSRFRFSGAGELNEMNCKDLKTIFFFSVGFVLLLGCVNYVMGIHKCQNSLNCTL